MSVWLVSVRAEATTEKEPDNEEADCKSSPSLRASGPAGAPSPLPMPGAAKLLTLPFSLKELLPCAHNPLGRLPAVA
jgi:hypothetical protein